MKIRSVASPNFDSRHGWAVDMLVLHYTDTRDAPEALFFLCGKEAQVSSHYLVDVNGEVLRLVDEKNRAWHAGKSFWRGWTNINQRSIGIEIVNPGHRYGPAPFPKVQMEAVAELCTGILSRHAVAARNVVAHSDIAPARKKDPGELFDWQWLAGAGVGLWPSDANSLPPRGGGLGRGGVFSKRDPLPLPPPTRGGGLRKGAEELADYGYDIVDLSAAIAAFQRRYRPRKIDGQWDGECAARLEALLAMV